MNEQLLTVSGVMSFLNISRATVYAWVKKGSLPRPLYFGGQNPRWKQAEILAMGHSEKQSSPTPT
jgi:predicted DNA-binding transcriptional regulator AlpA